MTVESDKLDRPEGITLTLTGGTKVTLIGAALHSPEAFRLAVERQTGFPARFTDAEFDDLIGALLTLSVTDEMAPAA